jgi:hypothetical protein
MSALRARMKNGHRPIVLAGGTWLVPDHPTYWAVPAAESDAVDQLVAVGQVEYAPEFARAGDVVVPQLQVVELAPAPARGDARPFARKAPRS